MAETEGKRQIEQELQVYDALPAELRQALREAPYDLDPNEVDRMLQRGFPVGVLVKRIRTAR